MAKGTVKWFDESKGYGFISRPDGPDVVVRRSGIHGEGYRSLEEGQQVEFDIQEDSKGPEATKVRKRNPEQ